MRLRHIFYPVLLGVAALAASCGQEASRREAGQYPTMVVGTGDRLLYSTYSATIKGRQDINIYAEVSGKITDVKVIEGQEVSKGQVMFIIDQVPYIAALRAAEANYNAAQVGVESAQLDYDSTKELYENGVVSEYEYLSAVNNLHSAEATLAQMEANKINAANNLSYTEVKSPADGVVGTLPYREGTLVSSGMATPLTTVSDNSVMYVYFSMNENKLLSMAREYGTIANAVKQMPDLQLKLSDGSIYEYPGRVASISGVISESTGTISLRAEFPNPDRLLHSGANGSVMIPEKYTDIIIIPQEATFEIQNKVFVYKVVDGVTKSSQITVSSISDGKEYIVTDGLNVGDVIISAGAGLVREGVRVAAPVATQESSDVAAESESEAVADNGTVAANE